MPSATKAKCNPSSIRHSLCFTELQLQMHADACLAAFYLITIRDNSSAQFFCLSVHNHKRLPRRQIPRCLTKRATVEQLVGMHHISYPEGTFFQHFSWSNSLLPISHGILNDSSSSCQATCNVQRSAKRRGCLLSHSQAEPGRELTQPRKHLLAEPLTFGIFS